MVVDFPEPVGPVTRIRPCSRAPHRVRSHSGSSERVQGGHPGLDATQDRAETAHGAVQVHAVARMRARDEAAVAIHVTVTIRIRTAGLPEGGHVYERHRFFTEHNDLFIDLKPRYLVLLKEDVTRLLLFRSVENAVDVLRHGSQLLPSRAATWQADSSETCPKVGLFDWLRIESPVNINPATPTLRIPKTLPPQDHEPLKFSDETPVDLPSRENAITAIRTISACEGADVAAVSFWFRGAPLSTVSAC